MTSDRQEYTGGLLVPVDEQSLLGEDEEISIEELGIHLAKTPDPVVMVNV